MARSQQVLDKSAWRRAHDFLGLMHEPAMCSSILGPSNRYPNRPGTVHWSQGGTKAVASIPFYLLGEKEGNYIATLTFPLPHSKYGILFLCKGPSYISKYVNKMFPSIFDILVC